MSVNPLSEIDNVVIDAYRQHADVLAAVGSADRIVVWDRPFDVRAAVDGAADLGPRLWVVPDACDEDDDFSTGEIKLVRRFRIGFGVGNLKLEGLRLIERAIMKATAMLLDRKKADGTGLEETQYPIEQIRKTRTDPEREPLGDPEEWTDYCGLEVVCLVPRGSI